MIYELDTDVLVKMVVSKLEEIDNLEVVLENPQADSKFPCAVVSTPLKSITITENGIPVQTNLSITIDYWTNKKYDSMKLSDMADKKMRELNFIRMNSPIDQYDEVTKKYRFGGNYEAFFNGLTNSLERRI